MNKKKIIIILIVAAVVVYIYMSQTPSSTSTDSESSGLFSQAIKALNEAKGKLNETKSELDTIKTDQQNKLTQEEIEARKNIEEMRRIARGLYDDIFSGGPVVDDYIRAVQNISDGALKVVAEEFQKMAPANQSLRQASLWKVIMTTPNQKEYPIGRVVENYTRYLPARLGSLGIN